MPNAKKMTVPRKTNSLAMNFRFRPNEAGASAGQVANHYLKGLVKSTKRAEAAENLQRHLVKHKGVGRKARRAALAK